MVSEVSWNGVRGESEWGEGEPEWGSYAVVSFT